MTTDMLRPDSPFGLALRIPDARLILEECGVLPLSEEQHYEFAPLPLRRVVETAPALMNDPSAVGTLLDRLMAIDPEQREPSDGQNRTVTSAEPHTPPRRITGGSGLLRYPASASRYGCVEILLDGPQGGSPYIDVVLDAIFTTPTGEEVTAPGFYDGRGRYVLRFLPTVEGRYTFATRSNAVALDGQHGHFVAGPAAASGSGPVRADGFHFLHDDGTPYHPFGTTAYAWLFQSEELQQQTLTTLQGSGFNKLRMFLLPKWFAFNESEPRHAPFMKDDGGTFDPTTPDLTFWRNVEARVSDLAALGIEADVILFHPYDRWGLSDMGREADDRFVRYAVARLSGFANVWWSLANEYDVVFSKTETDWERLGQLVASLDPASHLVSIHHCIEPYDHSRPWVTHASLQTSHIDLIRGWRDRWQKPIVIDECSYEGDLQFEWGNITAQELTHRHWEAMVRGGYAAHGETFADAEDVLWWSNGGVLKGESPPRLAFLRSIVESAPSPAIEPLDSGRVYPTGGAEGEYELTYFGTARPAKQTLLLDPRGRYDIDVIDTWAMSVVRVAHDVTGRVTVALPAKPFMAVQVRRARAHE